uniref:Uncharacterized protein n=1 Tax=Panagrolaimus sp. JU765 TaxID=591449 RepID=A0AC34QHV4_9BILA
MQDGRERASGTLRYSASHSKNIHISEQIRAEIMRFESVHPWIYTSYDLIHNIQDQDLQEQLRMQILNIEDAFVNSQEWTMSRVVNDIRLGVVGSLDSGKTPLVHYYLTEEYVPEPSAEGGRFKKEVLVNSRSHLLLIREEGSSSPNFEFTHWIDGVLIVFALDSRESFDIALQYYQQMEQNRNLSRIPVILVGTQDTCSPISPRVITEEEGRSAAMRYNMHKYFETNNAKFGSKVEEVFKEAYERVLQLRGLQKINERPYQDYFPTVDHRNIYHQRSMSTHLAQRDAAMFLEPRVSSQMSDISSRSMRPYSQIPNIHQYSNVTPAQSHNNLSSQISAPNSYFRSSSSLHPHSEYYSLNESYDGGSTITSTTSLQQPVGIASTSHLPTPTSTPTTQRKKRISQLFRSGHKDNNDNRPIKSECAVGPGRLIPIKQGILYKRSSKALNKEWKKKYVCLHSDGRLTYHQNIRDYMSKQVGKEVFLGLATVKLSSRNRPKSKIKAANPVGTTNGKENLNPPEEKNGANGIATTGDGTSGASDDQQFHLLSSASSSHVTTPVVNLIPSTSSSLKSIASKKQRGHRRLSSMGVGKMEDDEDAEFEIITNDQKRWEFSAANTEERDEWVALIEQQIERSLQAQMSQKQMTNRAHCSRNEVQAIRRMPGNNICADCSSPNPSWSAMNLGTLICIECSGIHRNMGSHISKVRSLELDDWPVEYVAVLNAIGNELANKVWEHNAPKDKKPQPDSPREIKENWIKMKYEQKRFLPPIPVDKTLSAQLLDAVMKRNMYALLNVLPRCSEKDINAPVNAYDRRTALHIACDNDSVEVLQILIWYNADLNLLDERGRSALWHANNISSDGCREILLHAGMPANYGVIESPTANFHNILPVDSHTKLSKKNLQSPDWQQLNDGLDEHLRFRAADHYNIRQPNYRHGTQGDAFDSNSTSAI